MFARLIKTQLEISFNSSVRTCSALTLVQVFLRLLSFYETTSHRSDVEVLALTVAKLLS